MSFYIYRANKNTMVVQRSIRWMDAEVFPDQFPVTFVGSMWFIALNSSTHEEVGYGGWRVHLTKGTKTVSDQLHFRSEVGFHYRSGVLPAARGHGLQKKLLQAREDDMKKYGLKQAITYTDPKSVASMRNLVDCGYKPFLPTPEMNMAGEGRAHLFVHWIKDL